AAFSAAAFSASVCSTVVLLPGLNVLDVPLLPHALRLNAMTVNVPIVFKDIFVPSFEYKDGLLRLTSAYIIN
ncbi:MAG: hypothetical protein Q4G28_12190, partial [Neisseria sp.]|nr:hypothetical protein [Neisseria sp.]